MGSTASNGPSVSVELDPLQRYVPTDDKAFLVEDFRLTKTERVSQTVSSVIPWILLVTLGVTPFLAMKYNLERMASKDSSISGRVLETKSARLPFRVMTFSSVVDILQRRLPTLVSFFDESFHSHVLSLLFREVDRLLSEHSIDVSLCAVPYSSVSQDFRAKYPSAPVVHLASPSDGTLFDFEGPWSAEGLVEFILPPSQISNAMRADIKTIEEKVVDFKKCLFAKRFIKKKHDAWTLEDSLNTDSLDLALVKCRAL